MSLLVKMEGDLLNTHNAQHRPKTRFDESLALSTAALQRSLIACKQEEEEEEEEEEEAVFIRDCHK